MMWGENVKKMMPKKLLEKRLVEMIEEDVQSYDLTSAFMPQKRVAAVIKTNEDCIVSGIYEVSILFGMFGIDVVESKKDGDFVKRGGTIFRISGNSREMLTAERTALNILSRMSGKSTQIKGLIDRAKAANPRIKVASSRKTTPLFRYFEKMGVSVGGGDTHRMSLNDCIMLKDNHLKVFGDIEKAIKAAKENASFAHKIEVEVENKKDAIKAARLGVDIIMFDNMPPEEIKTAIKELGALRKNVILEASGGITLDNIADYAKTGVDVVSVGKLNNITDMSLSIT